MNPLPPSIETGTFGEILVQIRLMQHGVQAAPPIKDTGNDLIAVREDCFRAVQVKTSTKGFPIKFKKKDLCKHYHILALVLLVDLEPTDPQNFRVSLDQSKIFLLDREKVNKLSWTESDLKEFELAKERVDELFPRQGC